MKRTYSRRNMTIKPEEGDSPPEIGQKRRKMNIQSEFKPINTLTRNISGNHSQRPFSGPTSFHGGDSDVETAYATPSRNVLKHPIVNKIVGSGKATSTIHGQGVRSFRTDMRESRTRPNAQGEEPASSCLKSHIDKPMVKQPRQNKIKDANRYGTSKNSMVPASKSSLHSIKKPVPQKGPKKLYASKTNDLTRSKISKKDVLGTRIDPGSPQAYLWNLNQTKSPLLRLPAEIRNRIYELVLGSKTIVIDFKPYHVNNSGVVERTFNYTPTTYRGHVNPFPARSISKSLFTTTKLTLMNSVCRQLYHETEILPFKLNCWAFEKYLTMMNFLFVDKQLMRKQRAAIKELLVTDQLPGGNLLDVMDGVQKVSLVGIATSAAPARRGRYHVVEVDGERSLEHDMLGRGG